MPADCLVLVPLRSFVDPKTRLSGALTPAQRSTLVRSLADAVLDAVDGLPVAVLTDDDEVAAWAHARGAGTIAADEPGLNPAVAAGHRAAIEAGYEWVAVVPADLARPADVAEVVAAATAGRATVSAAPDRHDDGTNLLVVPTDAEFDFAYGPGSFRRHRAEAERHGLPFVVIDHTDLGLDVDTPDDLADAHRDR